MLLFIYFFWAIKYTVKDTIVYKTYRLKCLALLLTFSVETELSADNHCITVIPVVVTHCSPLSLQAYLHSTLKIVPSSHQSNISVIASCNYRNRKVFLFKSSSTYWEWFDCIVKVCIKIGPQSLWFHQFNQWPNKRVHIQYKNYTYIYNM